MEQLIDLLPIESYETAAYYPNIVVDEAAQAWNAIAEQKGGILGEYGIPPVHDWHGTPEERFMTIDIARASHITKFMWIDMGILKCKVHLLGKYAEIAERLGVHFDGVPRATGVIGEDGVCTKYTLITVDIALTEIT